MCYKHLEINDFIKEVKDWYKFDFTERELRDIFKYYNNDEDEWFPTELNLRERWRFYKSCKEAIKDLWDKDSIYSVDDLDTEQKCMDWLEKYYYEMFIYTDGILIKID